MSARKFNRRGALAARVPLARDDTDALLREVADGATLWLVHVHADPDAIGAAFALARSLGGVVGESGGVAAPARRVAEKVSCAIDPMPDPAKFARVAVVDTSSRAQLGEIGKRLDPAALLLVDHHAYGDLAPLARLAVIDPSRASACEVALSLVRRAGRTLARDEALALLVGMISDTAQFRHANAATLADAHALASAHGLTVADALAVLDDEEPGGDLPRRIAQLKAAARAEIEERDGFLLARSRVSAHDADAASALLRLGADLAVVASERSVRARVSLRASRALLARGVHLGEIANAVAREVGWSGGGHEGAAGLNGKPPAANAADAVLARVRALLR